MLLSGEDLCAGSRGEPLRVADATYNHIMRGTRNATAKDSAPSFDRFFAAQS